MAEMRGMTILQHEIEKAKDKLKDVNENIKKLTGRDPHDLRSAPVRGRAQETRGRGRLFGLARRGIMLEESGGRPPPPPARGRSARGAFSRLGPMPGRRRVREDSGDEDEPPTKLSVQSSVVSTGRDARSRQDTMAEQSKDREGLQRNRRMFGLLLGTLQKFKTEAKVRDEKAEQRKQIEKKLEEEADKEKKRYHQETQQLIEESQLEQAKISRLQQKMELVNEHEVTTNEMKKLHNFICTNTKPRIFWKPKSMNSAAESRLKDSRKVVDKMIKEKDLALDREIKQVMEREHEREDRIRSRLHTGKENTDEAPRDEERPLLGRDSNKESRRKSHDKKEGHAHRPGQGHGHKEAKKKQHEMQYDDGEEEEMEGEVATPHSDLGHRTSGEAGEGGGKGVEEEGEIKEEPNSPAKADKFEDDGNNTDVDYEDDEHSDGEAEKERAVIGTEKERAVTGLEKERAVTGLEKERAVTGTEAVIGLEKERAVTGTEALATIPMPPEPTVGEGGEEEENDIPLGPVEPGRVVQEEREVVTVRLAQVGGGGTEGMDDQELEMMEARRRRAVMAEDGEDMEEEPADE